MDYYDILARVLFEERFLPVRTRDINTDPRFMELYRDWKQ